MARWRPWVVISAVTWQRYCANKNGSEKPVSNCWRRVDLPGRVVHRASQGGWSKRLSLMHMRKHPRFFWIFSLMPDCQHYTPDEVIAAVIRCHGLLHAAARTLGCSYRTLRNYRARYPCVQTAMDAA